MWEEKKVGLNPDSATLNRMVLNKFAVPWYVKER